MSALCRRGVCQDCEASLDGGQQSDLSLPRWSLQPPVIRPPETSMQCVRPRTSAFDARLATRTCRPVLLLGELWMQPSRLTHNLNKSPDQTHFQLQSPRLKLIGTITMAIAIALVHTFRACNHGLSASFVHSERINGCIASGTALDPRPVQRASRVMEA